MNDTIGIAALVLVFFFLWNPERIGESAARVVAAFQDGQTEATKLKCE